MRSHLEYLFLGGRCREVGASSPHSPETLGAAAALETEQGQLWGQRHCKNMAESAWIIWQEKTKLATGGRGGQNQIRPWGLANWSCKIPNKSAQVVATALGFLLRVACDKLKGEILSLIIMIIVIILIILLWILISMRLFCDPGCHCLFSWFNLHHSSSLLLTGSNTNILRWNSLTWNVKQNCNYLNLIYMCLFIVCSVGQ